jgi:hypothetical protein
MSGGEFMITSVDKATKMMCLGNFMMKCRAPDCLGWEYYVEIKEDDDHIPIPDNEKKGYCGLSISRDVKPHPKTRQTVVTVLEINSDGSTS